MDTDRAAFIAAVVAAPDDDLPRLAFADALDRGDGGFPPDSDRAEFIRVQVELAKWEPVTQRFADGTQSYRDYALLNPDVTALRRREAELLAGRAWQWAGKAVRDAFVAGTAWDSVLTFSRGFVSAVSLAWAEWVKYADTLLAQCPLRRVNRPRECATCYGTGSVSLMDLTPLESRCHSCNGTGRVDDWRGGGKVVLTSWPEWEMPPSGTTFDDDHLRFHGRPWHRIPFGRFPPGRGREAITQSLLAAEWPGVRFELPRYGPSDPRINEAARRAVFGAIADSRRRAGV